MQKYEYKFVKDQISLGLDYNKKLQEAEAQWNQLGQQGWRYCRTGNGCTIFIREIPQETEN